ncbi:MAG: ATP-binding protein [Deltaproteobacteria bacterium]|nr:ATP-binding protein [Deltaproteobacteria bacterium]
MNQTGDLSTALYNPDLIGRAELIEQFVARKSLLALMVDDLRHERPQHWLLLGQRGMGKSTMLRRLRYAIEDDPELSSRWIPLSFPEEQYNVAHLSDFWANCLDALSLALSERGREEESHTLDARAKALPRGDEGERSRESLSMLRECGTTLKAGFILLLDNFNIVLDRLSSQEHWVLRKALSGTELALVGGCVAPPEEAFSHDGAFYDWFNVHELRPLSLDDAREVLLYLAKVRNAPSVEQVVLADRGRLAALHRLTGGNPRALLLLHDLLAREGIRTIAQDLAGLLDHCTPLYKARFEAFSHQQQHVLDALALHWAPATAAEIAARTGLSVQSVSSQLDRLVGQGVVEKVPSESPRQLFQVGERLFNIWYLMRAGPRTRRSILWLAEFLRSFYGENSLRLQARELFTLPLPSPVEERERYVTLIMAIAKVVNDATLCNALELRAVEAIVDMHELRAQLGDILDLSGDDAHLEAAIDRLETLRELESAVLRSRVRLRKGWDPKRFWHLLGGAASLTLAEKRRTVEELHSLEPRRLRALIRTLEMEEGKWRRGASTARLPEAIRRGYMVSANDVVGAAAIAPEFGPGLLNEAFLRSLAASPRATELETMGRFLPLVVDAASWARWILLTARTQNSLESLERWLAVAGMGVQFWTEVVIHFDRISKWTTMAMCEAVDLTFARRCAFACGLLCERIVSLEAPSLLTLRLVAMVRQMQNDPARSLDCWRQVVQHPDATATDWDAFAQSNVAVGRTEDSISSWRRAIALDPGQTKMRISLCMQLCLRSGQEAINTLRGGTQDPDIDLFGCILELLISPAHTPKLIARIARILPEATDLTVITFSMVALINLDLPLLREVSAKLLTLDGRALPVPLVLAAETSMGNLDKARVILRSFLSSIPGSELTQPLTPLSSKVLLYCARHGLAAETSETFDACPLAERLLPLQAALRILAFPARFSIERLPAELRQPTQDLLGVPPDNADARAPFRIPDDPSA